MRDAEATCGRTPVGVLGLGIIGSAMARNISRLHAKDARIVLAAARGRTPAE